MTNKKLQALDAIKSLVVTATKWTEMEFPTLIPGVEEQTIREVSQLLLKANVALDNLMLYEKGLLNGVEYIQGKDHELIKIETVGD